MHSHVHQNRRRDNAYPQSDTTGSRIDLTSQSMLKLTHHTGHQSQHRPRRSDIYDCLVLCSTVSWRNPPPASRRRNGRNIEQWSWARRLRRSSRSVCARDDCLKMPTFPPPTSRSSPANVRRNRLSGNDRAWVAYFFNRPSCYERWNLETIFYESAHPIEGWLGSRVVSVLGSGSEGPSSNRSRDAVW